MERGGTVYILTNYVNTVLYTGVTSDLYNRVLSHRNKIYPESFTAKYNCCKLVWYCFFSTIIEAIAEEKRIKGGNRNSKMKLVSELNPSWEDLFEREVRYW
jgi:putative endonuclease